MANGNTLVTEVGRHLAQPVAMLPRWSLIVENCGHGIKMYSIFKVHSPYVTINYHSSGSRCRHPALEFAQIGVSDGLILRRPHIAKLPWAMCMFRVFDCHLFPAGDPEACLSSWKLFPAPRRDVHRPNIPSTHPKLNAHLPSFIYLPILPRPPSKQHFRHSFPFLCHQILLLLFRIKELLSTLKNL